ncbi:sodium:solute symporter [Aneurinibacillus aneurinilyticus]|uniref:sodium:solute symporter n=1 Tax=Aneurinibacillus aneurinilyticus TaxID=1391 RepID=UPI0023F75FC0|nr:sodium:solute symporter [Aneurinibacillus aneurinilyticus]MCI1694031.1 sodium:solute symporter [Aneurinibacillus aneurinilyticus]
MHTLDIMVMIVYFLALIFVGFIGARKAKTSEDYIVAGRNLGFTMYLSCLAAVILGGASTIGTTKLGYQYGISGVWLVSMLGIGIISLGLFLVKKIYHLKILTISELLELRFNAQTRLISAAVTALYAIMVTVTQVIGMRTILNVLVGWNLTLSMLVGGGIVLFYTLLGGMWSVTMTDIVQFVIMTIGIFLVMLPLSISKAGGWANLQQILPASYFDFTGIGWSEILSYFLLFCLGMVIAQDVWQRIFTAKNLKIARTGTIGAGVYSFLYALAVSIIGMCAFVVLPGLSNPQNAFAQMAVTILPVGLLGLVLASVVSALMSTASGTLLASSTLIVNDIIKRFSKKPMSETRFLLTSRITTLVIGLIVIICSIWIQDVLVALDVAYAVLSGSVFLPIILGLFWKRATAKAAFYSIIISAIVIIAGLAIEGLTSTNPILYGLASSLISIVLISYLDPAKNSSETEERMEKVYEASEQKRNAL